MAGGQRLQSSLRKSGPSLEKWPATRPWTETEVRTADWLWLNVPLMAVFFLAMTRVPRWLVFRHPDAVPAAAPSEPRRQRCPAAARAPRELAVAPGNRPSGRRSTARTGVLI